MNRLMKFYIELHEIEKVTSVETTPEELKKRVFQVVETYFPYADQEFKECAFYRCLQGVAYNYERNLLTECIKRYSSLEFGGEICK